ncbi:MAG TPA: hypothetical protein VM223_00430 [Planctomycetota bacterium]|nr:hypothetical protein [Planctomycetota bacterium]
MLPSTAERVARYTMKSSNRTIRDLTAVNVARYGTADPDTLSHRLYRLDREWDIERTLEVIAPIVSFIGIALAVTLNIWWLALTGLALASMLLHAFVGWCPPVVPLRLMGFRTATEIDYERYSLKAVRGDFQRIPAITEQQELARIDELLENVKH